MTKQTKQVEQAEWEKEFDEARKWMDVFGKRKHKKIENKVWFIEDDNPDYLRYVNKVAIPDDEYKVVIKIYRTDDPDNPLSNIKA